MCRLGPQKPMDVVVASIHVLWISVPSREYQHIAQAQLLLTLSAAALQDRIESKEDSLTLQDVPDFANTELGLRGVTIQASQLVGLGIQDLEKIRDSADKASCPVLLLVEDTPMVFGDPSPAAQEMIRARIQRLGVAATALGASGLGVSCEGENDEQRFDQAAASIRSAMQTIDRHEVNLLLSPRPGLTGEPERLTELIKKVGGFRIGSLPDFKLAHETGDFISALRRLAPYAGAMFATLGKGKKKSDVAPYSLAEGLEAVLAVGYQNTICLHHEGPGDAVAAIISAREQLMSALEVDVEKD